MATRTADELKVLVKAEVGRAVKDLKRASGAVGQVESSAARAAKSLVRQGVAAAGLSVSIGTLVHGMRQSIDAASEAEEVYSKFTTVFRNQAAEVEAWAETFSDSISRSATATMSFLSTIQDTLVPLGFTRDAAAEMSKEVVELAYDLASFNNLPTEEVVRGIQSALVGNTENLRRYGVVAQEAQIKQELLNSGLWNGEGAISAVDKAQAIFNLTVEGSTDAMGDLVRTADSWENVSKSIEDNTRSLREEFGKLVTDGLRPAQRWWADFTKGLAGGLAYINDSKEAAQLLTEIWGSIENGTATQNDLNAAIMETNQLIAETVVELREEREEGWAGNKRLIGIWEDKIERLIEERTTLRESLRVLEDQEFAQQLLLEKETARAEQEERIQAALEKQEESAEAAAIQRQAEALAARERADAAGREQLELYYGVILSNRTELERLYDLQEEIKSFDWLEGNVNQLEAQNAALAVVNRLIDEQLGLQEESIEQTSTLQEILDGISRTERERRDLMEAYDEAQQQMQDAMLMGNTELVDLYAEALGLLRERLGLTSEIANEQERNLTAIEQFEERMKAIVNLDTVAGNLAGTLSEIGEAMAESADIGDTAAESVRKFLAAITGQIATSAIAAGLRIIAEQGSAGLPMGVTLLAIGGITAVASGIAGASTRTEGVGGVLGAEERLKQERIRLVEETIETERQLREDNLRKLRDQFDVEFEVLRDLWQRNLLSSEEFEEQAGELKAELRADEDLATEPTAAEKLQSAKDEKIDWLQGYVDTWKQEISEIPWWEKLLTQKDERLQGYIEDHQERIAKVDEATTMAGVAAARSGADFVTSGPELLMVGDNPGGRERVMVEPLSSANTNGPGGMTVHIHGDVYGIDRLAEKLEAAMRQNHRRGRVA